MKLLSIIVFIISIFSESSTIAAVSLKLTKTKGDFLSINEPKFLKLTDSLGEQKGLKDAKIRKSAIYFQALGNTPFVGMGYRFRIYEKSDFLLESGFGVGFTPLLGWEGGRKTVYPFLSYSTHTNVVIKTGLKIAPVVGLSGVLYGGIETSRRRFALIPSPSIGLRLGKLNKSSFNLMWNAYFYKVQYYEYPSTSTRIITRQFKLAYGPSANLQYSF